MCVYVCVYVCVCVIKIIVDFSVVCFGLFSVCVCVCVCLRFHVHDSLRNKQERVLQLLCSKSHSLVHISFNEYNLCKFKRFSISFFQFCHINCCVICL